MSKSEVNKCCVQLLDPDSRATCFHYFGVSKFFLKYYFFKVIFMFFTREVFPRTSFPRTQLPSTPYSTSRIGTKGHKGGSRTTD